LHGTSPERSETDVNEILERTLELRLYQLRVENIDVHTELAPQSLKTWADGNQLQQVFLNLINNAEDAMVAHRGGGQLFVRSSLRDGDIVVEVQDTGPGLSAKAQEHLFEPFFTTKEVGKGTGLGLSICFGIVTEHNGYIEVDSELGEGTTVRVIIPVQTQPDDLPENSEPPPPEVHDGKRILVVDDEPDVAGLVRRILQQHGHQVLVARDGQQALDALLGDLAVPVDAIISDVKMPGLNGQQFYERLCRDAPELAARMLFMTGDTLSPETRAFLQQVNVPRLPKPFSVDDLLRSLAELLGDKQDG